MKEVPSTQIERTSAPNYNETRRPRRLLAAKNPIDSGPWFKKRDTLQVRGVYQQPYGS